MKQNPNSSQTDNAASAQNGLSVTFMLLSVLFVVCLIVSNLIEIKTVDLGWFTITAGVVVFPVSYIINDCVVEVYGFRKARLMIWTGFAMSLMVALFLQLAIALPGGEEWHSQDAMEAVYGGVPRIMAASFMAFICGSMVNAYVMSRMKVSAGDAKHSIGSFSLRAMVSTLWGEGIDSVIFFPIAFGGVLDWTTVCSLILTQVLIKTVYEMAVLPLTITIVRRLKKAEGLDTIDNDVDYRWWRLADL
ncbi:MAG: queuosine precursor transporter [Bacteroidales bacterium]|nr:queuosine precursor transporter [Bacteroidales bacterium]